MESWKGNEMWSGRRGAAKWRKKGVKALEGSPIKSAALKPE